MTPIKHILVSGIRIFTVDWADKAEFLANAGTREKAEWIGWSLARAHSVELVMEDSNG